MNESERAFPVTLDPAVCTAPGEFTFLYVNSSAPTYNYADAVTAYVYSNRTAYWKTNSISFIPKNSYISNATLRLYGTSNSSSYISAHTVTSAWDSTLTYEKTQGSAPNGAVSEDFLSYIKIDSQDENHFYSLDITEAVRKWYDNLSTNYGIALKYIQGDSAYFLKTNNESLDARPSLSVSYVSHVGLESYNSYSSHIAGGVANGYVNLATGSLTVDIPILSATNSLMPYTVSLVYNSAYANAVLYYSNSNTPYSNSVAPFGFKWSMQQSVVKRTCYNENGELNDMYIWCDADGTEHSFFKKEGSEGLYIDNDGMGLKLSESGTEITITSKDRTVSTFSSISCSSGSTFTAAWQLSSIADRNGNKLLFNYDELYIKPLNVKLDPAGAEVGEIEILRFVYSENSTVPKAVYDVITGRGAVFSFSSANDGSISETARQYLRCVDFVTGNAAWSDNNWLAPLNAETIASLSLEYLSNGYIDTVYEQISERGIKYTYSSSKVSEVKELAALNVGQKLTYVYGSGYTDVRNSGTDDIHGNDDDIITRSVFDSYGRAVSVYTKNPYGAIVHGSAGEYETSENSKNSLKEIIDVKEGLPSYLLNGGFEDGNNGFEYWTKTSGVTIEVEYNMEPYTTGKAKFTVSGSNEERISQSVSLMSGTYTIAFDMTSTFAADVDVWLRVTSVTNSFNSQIFKLPKNDTLNDFNVSTFTKRLSQTFEISDAQNFRIDIAVVGNGSASSAIVFLDNVMLTSGESAAAYNMVDLGGFDTFAIDSSQNSIPVSSVWDLPSGSVLSAAYPSFSGNGIRIECNSITDTKEATQRIYSPGYNSTSYFERKFIVSGYAKSTGASIGTDAEFLIRIDVGYSDSVESFVLNFNPNCKDWQFATGSFTTLAYRKISYIDVSCVFSGQNQAVAYFDNIAVIDATDYVTRQYEYYEESGNIKSETLSGETVIYIYDEADPNLLTFKADSDGILYEYEYDNKGNLIGETLSDYYINAHGSYGKVSAYYLLDKDNVDSLITKSVIMTTEYELDGYGLVKGETVYTANESKVIKSSYTYETSSQNPTFFGTLKSSVDTLGNTVYYYNEIIDGEIVSVAFDGESGTGTASVSDIWGNPIKVLPVVNGNPTGYTLLSDTEFVLYDYNARNELAYISTSSTDYSFTYDVYGNPLTVSAGNAQLASYSYNSDNGKISKVTYGNGFAVEYVYGELENLTEVWYTVNGERTQAYRYSYTDSGLLFKVEDLRSGKSNVYNYDKSGRITLTSEYCASGMANYFSAGYKYDEFGNINNVNYKLAYNAGGVDRDSYSYINYYYGDLQNLTRESYSMQNTSGYDYLDTYYTYDAFQRAAGIAVNFGSGFSINTDYTFTEKSFNTESGTSEHTSTQIKTYTNTVNGSASSSFSYTYDSKGNITAVTVNGAEHYRYVYDNLSQLIREDNVPKNQTYIYEYDNSGNITAKKIYPLTAKNQTPSGSCTTVSYGYSEGAWGDILTSYNGAAITYDEIGNPISYYGNRSFTWEGRRLVGATLNSKAISFNYNDEGLRTSKTVNGVTTNYYFVSSQLMAEETNGNITVYLYNSTGIVGFRYRAASYAQDVWDTYLYEKNLQGDIIAVYDASGNKKISYTYDAWGNFTATYHNGASSANLHNPYTYRGYYYDSDLSLYYLNSRYYDSNIGRFVNVDNIISGVGGNILGNNVFAYCFNNPVNMDDGTGNWPQWLKNSVKWVAKNIVKPVVKSIQSTLADVDLTYTAGISGSITPGKTLENAQIGIAMDTKGTVEIQYSLNGGVTTGSMSGSIAGYNTITNATRVDKLTGPGYQIGGSYTGAPVIVGGDLNIIPDPDENTT